MSKLSSSGPVTALNFQERGRSFIAANGNEGFLISLRLGRHQGINHQATPDQWQAWRNYRIKLGLGITFMDRVGVEGRAFTVPCEWPTEFDPQANLPPRNTSQILKFRKDTDA